MTSKRNIVKASKELIQVMTDLSGEDIWNQLREDAENGDFLAFAFVDLYDATRNSTDRVIVSKAKTLIDILNALMGGESFWNELKREANPFAVALYALYEAVTK